MCCASRMKRSHPLCTWSKPVTEMDRGCPAPTGSNVICRAWLVETESAHFPSGDKLPLLPSPRRTGSVPSVLRIATAYPGPAASLESSKRTNCPSREMSRGEFESCQERSISESLFKFVNPIDKRLEFSETRTRPSLAISCSVIAPGKSRTGRVFAVQINRPEVQVGSLFSCCEPYLLAVRPPCQSGRCIPFLGQVTNAPATSQQPAPVPGYPREQGDR